MSSKYGFTNRDEARLQEQAKKASAANKRVTETRARIGDAVTDVLQDYNRSRGYDPDLPATFDDKRRDWHLLGSETKVNLVDGDTPKLQIRDAEWSGQGVAAAKALSKGTGLPVEVVEKYTVEKVDNPARLMGSLGQGHSTIRRTETKTRVRKFNPDGTEASSGD